MAMSNGSWNTNYGVYNSQNILELFYAIEHGTYTTGEFTVSNYFPANQEREILDTGLGNNVRGIIICDEQNANTSNTENLMMNYGYIGLAETEGDDQPIGTGTSFQRRRGGAEKTFFGNRMSSYRVNGGKLYATPVYAQNNYTYFQKGHTYRWFAWPHESE